MSRDRKKGSGLLRTGLLLTVFSTALTGCGFKPLYETSEKDAGVAEELKKVYVARIPDRPGQLLRLALQENMAGDGPEDPQGYTLRVSYSMNSEGIDIHSDNTSGRLRVNGNANWMLFTVAESPVLVAQGSANTMDGMNVTYQQDFARSMNMETVQERLAKTLAAQITQQVSVWFRNHTQAPIQEKHERVYYQDSGAMAESSQEPPRQAAGADGMPAMASGRDDPDPNR